MYRHTLFMLLAAFVVWGMSMALPDPVSAQGPMIARADSGGPMLASDFSEDESGLAGPALAEEAFTVLYNSERLMRARHEHAKAFIHTDAPEPKLSDDEESLSRILGAGPSLARMNGGARHYRDKI